MSCKRGYHKKGNKCVRKHKDNNTLKDNFRNIFTKREVVIGEMTVFAIALGIPFIWSGWNIFNYLRDMPWYYIPLCIITSLFAGFLIERWGRDLVRYKLWD